jgi:hypothetical protein
MNDTELETSQNTLCYENINFKIKFVTFSKSKNLANKYFVGRVHTETTNSNTSLVINTLEK